jgi:hypothetical protein
MSHVECGFAGRRRRNMTDHLLLYRSCGAESRDDYLRMLADENGLPLSIVERAAGRLGSAEEFGALVAFCECGGRTVQ